MKSSLNVILRHLQIRTRDWIYIYIYMSFIAKYTAFKSALSNISINYTVFTFNANWTYLQVSQLGIIDYYTL